MPFELTNPFLGAWTYRSFLNDPDQTNPNFLPLFGMGTLTFEEAPMGQVKGSIGTPGSWMLDLEGISPMATRTRPASRERETCRARRGFTTTSATT